MSTGRKEREKDEDAEEDGPAGTLTTRAPEYGGHLRSPWTGTRMLRPDGPQIPENQKSSDYSGFGYLAHIKTARCWGHGDLIPHGPEAGNRNRRP